LYSVRLGFIARPEDKVGNRIFDIKIQDKIIRENFDILKETGIHEKAVTLELGNFNVTGNLVIEFIPKTVEPDKNQAPLLNCIYILRENVKVASVFKK